jgi:sugar-specific transcriptional regulator TrmB
MEEIINTFRGLNLTEKEIKVYLTLLRSGTLGATQIAKLSKLNRITTYHILKELIEKGLVSYVIKSGIKSFKASNPKTIIEDLKEKENKFLEILPQLEALKESVLQHATMEVYEGKEGLKTIMNDWIITKKEIFGFGTEELNNIMGNYFPNYVQRRVENGIKIKLLLENSKYAKEMQLKDKKELRETKIINIDKITTGIYVYGNKVAFLTFEKNEPLGYIIEDKSLAKTIRIILELIWKIK